MIIRSELKNKAKEQIKGNIGILFVCNLVVVAVCAVVALIPELIPPIASYGIGAMAVNIVMPAFMISLIMIYLGLAAGKKPNVPDVFKGLNIFGKALWLIIITEFFVALWSMLLVIPGIIKGISYSMAPYVLADNPNMTAREALRESKKIMQGHKMDYFILALSFFWWFLLIGATFGIAGIYAGPYIQATITNFYNKIK